MRNRNTLCIYDKTVKSSSLAAAIVKKFWIDKNKDMPEDAGEMIMSIGHKIASFYGIINFHSWKQGEEIPDYSPYDKVILLGITFPENDMRDLYKKLKRDLVWIENRKSELYKIHNLSLGDKSLLHLIDGLRGDMYNIAELTWIMYSRLGLEDAPAIVRKPDTKITDYREYYDIINGFKE